MACSGKGVWNKGLTVNTDERVKAYGARRRGVPAPAHVKAALIASLKGPKWKAAHAAAQKRRFSDPAQREQNRQRAFKLIEQGKIIPFGGRGHGNGGEPTKAEASLFKRLRRYGFQREVVVKAGKIANVNWYRLDLAHLEARVAVEIDGSSHEAKRRRESDSKKDSFLTSQGWTVLRFQDTRKSPFVLSEVVRLCVAAISSTSALSTI